MDVYATITQTIIEAIEQNPGNPIMPWHRSTAGLPKNATTNTAYNGINVLCLWASAAINGYTSGEWASYKQWQEIGGQVRKGAKSSVIVFYKPLPEKEGETDRRFVLKYSRVFNATQVEGYEPPSEAVQAPVERLEAADGAIKATGIKITEQGDMACYVPSRDEVFIPDNWRFFDTDTSTRQEAYYSTIFHELVHATGHKTRLDRNLGNKFGSPEYAFEELVAELGAAFCCARLVITPEVRQDHAQYLNNWLKALKDDPRAIFKASAFAQKATDFLL